MTNNIQRRDGQTN